MSTREGQVPLHDGRSGGARRLLSFEGFSTHRRHDYLQHVRRPADLSMPLSIEDAWLLVTALVVHVDAWRRHDEKDGWSSHTPAEWEAVRTEAGQWNWRLEELAVQSGQVVQHDEHAVRPPDDEDGGEAVVRESRQPNQPSPTAVLSP